MTAASKPQRPSLAFLLGTYALWIGAIAALFMHPISAVGGTIAWALLLFVWLPLWAWMNWSTVVEDLPATYATIVVSLLLILLLGLNFEFGFTSIVYEFFQLSNPNVYDTLVTWLVIFSIPPIWRKLRRLFTRVTPQATQNPASKTIS